MADNTENSDDRSAEEMSDQEHSDLGFGRFVAQSVRGRFLTREGLPVSRKYGLGAQRTEQAYLGAMNASWPVFFGWVFGVVLLMNGIFALLFTYLPEGSLTGMDTLGLSDKFLQAFFFSVGTFTTTGNSGMHAVGAPANWLVAFESIIGPLSLAAAVGLLIARLSRPRAKMLFSESAVVAPYEGGRGLMFRMVNARRSELSDVRVQVSLIWFELVDGKRERNFHRLELERDSVEFFTLHWTVVHPITATSPLRGVTPDKLREAEAEVVISVSAHEETFSTRVISRSSYLWDEIRWDVKFASIFTSAPDGVIAIDVDRLGRTERLAEGATRLPAELESGDQEKLRIG